MTIALPTYARAIMASASDTPKPLVDRVEMDRGPAQQRLNGPRVLFNSAIELLFESQNDVNSFIDWYVTTLGVVGWFTMKHPRTGATITARFPMGTLGDIVPIIGGYGMSSVTTAIEYYP